MNELETKEVFLDVLLPMTIAVAAVMVVVMTADKDVFLVDVVELLDSADVTVVLVRIFVVDNRVVVASVVELVVSGRVVVVVSINLVGISVVNS